MLQEGGRATMVPRWVKRETVYSSCSNGGALEDMGCETSKSEERKECERPTCSFQGSSDEGIVVEEA
jgi:hypothetical protein